MKIELSPLGKLVALGLVAAVAIAAAVAQAPDARRYIKMESM